MKCGGEHRACGRTKRRARVFFFFSRRVASVLLSKYPLPAFNGGFRHRRSTLAMANGVIGTLTHDTHPSYSTRTARNRRNPYLLGEYTGLGGNPATLLGHLFELRAPGNHDYVLLALLFSILLFLGVIGCRRVSASILARRQGQGSSV